jgi:2-oxoglutarate ferredoxin oxidoreductase subunit alpha
MVYVGVLAQILGIDLDKIYQALNFHFKGRPKPIDMNLTCSDGRRLGAQEPRSGIMPRQAMNATDGYIMADGNTAALGAIYGACILPRGTQLHLRRAWPKGFWFICRC